MTWILPENVTNLYDLLVWGQEVTNYTFLPAFFIVFTLVVFLTVKSVGYTNARALAPAAFIGAIGCTMFNAIGMISGWIVLVYWILTGVALIFLRFEQ
jgi:hypothetical protein